VFLGIVFFSCSDVYIQVVYSSSSSSYRVVLNPLRIPIFPDLAPVFPLQRSSSESSSYLSFLVVLRVMAVGRAFDSDRSPLGKTPTMSADDAERVQTTYQRFAT
jgi:hypothetical protein